jgi:hypothetical protein
MKNMTNVSRFLSLVLLMTMTALFSCQKENSKATQAENEQFAQAVTESDAESEAIFDDVFDNIMGVNTEVGVGGTGVFGQAIIIRVKRSSLAQTELIAHRPVLL